MQDHIEAFKKFTEELGVDLSKWELEDDTLVSDIAPICRELLYRNEIQSEFTMFAAIQYLKKAEWAIVEFLMTDN